MSLDINLNGKTATLIKQILQEVISDGLPMFMEAKTAIDTFFGHDALTDEQKAAIDTALEASHKRLQDRLAGG